MLRTLALLTLVGCIQQPDSLRTYEHHLDRMRKLVEVHQAEVGAAGSLDEVDELESQHHADWDMEVQDMRSTIDGMEGCGMHGSGMAMMDDAYHQLDGMMEEMRQHGQRHGEHEHLSQCQDEEQTHAETLHDHLDAMAAHTEHWREEGWMDCGHMRR